MGRLCSVIVLAGLGTLLTLGLIGASLALYSPAVRRRSSNRRSDDLSPAEEYAERIDEFEDKLTQNLGQSARQATRRVAHGVRGGLRRLGLLGRLGARAFTSVKSGVDTAARMAQYGIKAARRMARTGVARIGVGIARAGRASRNRLGRVGYALNSGFGRIGSAYSRGLRRVGTAARMGVDRMGTVASEGVSRIGEMASDSAQAVGGLATDLVDVAAVVPRGVMAAAKEKKVRDCLLQTLCYVSTPLVNPEAASRHRRCVRTLFSSCTSTYRYSRTST